VNALGNRIMAERIADHIVREERARAPQDGDTEIRHD
jgi:hypothetical protein